ncbi:MAG: hypothetical protein FWE06_02115 [Oscillospiraceae bacterium]|nr:hypothetical protein [Oscillospiraceae bacterium]
MKLRRILAVGMILMLATALVIPASANTDNVINVLTLPVAGWESSLPGAGNGGTTTAAITGGALVITNADGGWPSSTYELDDIISIPRAEWGNLYLFFNITVPANAETAISFFHGEVGGDASSLAMNRSIVPNDAERSNVGDIKAGTYEGYVSLAWALDNVTRIETVGTEHTIQTNAFTGDTLELAGIRIHAVGPNGTEITVRELRIGPAGSDNQPGEDGTAPPSTATPTPAPDATASPTAAPTGTPGPNPPTADAGVAMIVMTGLAGLAGTGLLIGKKRK